VTAMVIALGLLTAPAAPVPLEGKKDALNGTWEQVSNENPVGKVPEDLVWNFEKEQVTAYPKSKPEKVIFTYKFAAESGKDPKEISLTFEHGERKWVQHGIYKLEGDRLTICLGVAAGDAAVNESKRPTEYKAGPDTSLVVLKRSEK
jgi:uncharacterized protein (TIGR03067 family)